MRHYRQHPIVLWDGLLEGLAMMVLGIGLTLLSGQPFWWVLGLLVALLRLIWKCVRWFSFSLRIEGRQVTLRTLKGLVINERVVSLNAPGGLRLHQNPAGYLYDYGTLRIETFGEAVQIAYLSPFSALKRQIDG